MIPARAWHRMRTGSGTKGTRHYDWAMLEVTSDDTLGGHEDGHSVLLARRHRYTGTLSYYRCWTPGRVPLSRLIAIVVTRWRIEEDHQLAEQSTGLDAGLIPITVPELLRLLRDTVIPPPRRDRTHRLHWSTWRRRHQHRARANAGTPTPR
jgi:hypothetical protein